MIAVTGTVTHTGESEWDGEGVTLVRYATFKYALVDVAGGKLTLKNITFDGAYEMANVTSSAPLIKLSGGELVLDQGTTLQNNVRTGGNKYEGGGGVYANGGTLTMKDGSLIRNNYAHNGGGVSLMQNKPVFNMEGGTIEGNRTSVNGNYSTTEAWQTSGGGVFIAYDSVMNMSGGTVAGNTAYSGAGISLGGPENTAFFNGYHPTFNMTGGVIEGNTAYSNGGGMFVQMNCTATLDARTSGQQIYIRNNHTRALGGGVNYGGGGIYVNGGKDTNYVNGTLQLYNVEIGNNTAKTLSGISATGQGEGAAIAACPTSDTKIYVTNGGVIHDNNGIDLYLFSGNLSGSHVGISSLKLASYMLGGGAYHWSAENGNELPLNGGFVQVYGEEFFAKTTTTGSNVTGLKQCSTHITGNTSGGRGGAIGSNGNVIIGKADDSASIRVTVDKKWKGDNDNSDNTRPNSIDVLIIAIRPDGTEIDQGFLRLTEFNEAGEQWTATYSGLPRQDENGALFVYTIREVKVEDYTGEITDCEVIKKGDGATDGIPEFEVTAPNSGEGGDSVKTITIAQKVNSETQADATFTFTVTSENEAVKSNTYEVEFINCEPVTAAAAQFRMARVRSTATVPTTVMFDETGKAELTVRWTGESDLSVIIKGLPDASYTVSNGTSSQKVTLGGNSSGEDECEEIRFELTNTLETGDLTISKLVTGLDDGAFGQSMTFTFTVEAVGDALKQKVGSKTYGDVVFVNGVATVEIEVNEQNVATTRTITGLPWGDYNVIEDQAAARVIGYNLNPSIISPVTVGKDGDGLSTVTNTYVPNSGSTSTRLTVRKVWLNDEGVDRPQSVTVQLLRNGRPSGEPVTLNEGNRWRHTWTGLNENYSWSVDEVEVPEGYTREVTKSGTTYTITNTYTEPEIPEDPTPLNSLLSVRKVWAGDLPANRPDSVTVQLFKDGKVDETVTLNDANGWSWSRVLSKEELASKWTVSEVEVPAGYTSVVTTGDDGISFTVTNTFATTPEKPDEPETPDIPDEEPPKTDTPDEPVDVPDEQPPLTDLPDEQPPLAEIPVEWPPLAEIPVEQPPLVEVPEDIPLIPAEPEVTVPEEPVPMVGIPQTGDFSMVWYAVAILSALGLAVLTLKKREGEEG